MRIFAKNIPTKYHLDHIWNNGDLGFFEEVMAQLLKKKKKNNIIINNNNNIWHLSNYILTV